MFRVSYAVLFPWRRGKIFNLRGIQEQKWNLALFLRFQSLCNSRLAFLFHFNHCFPPFFKDIRAICANLGNGGRAEPASHTTKFSKTFDSEESLAPVVDGSTNLGSPTEFQVLYNGAR